MSWSELERLVETAELDDGIRRALGHCRSLTELVLASRRLGFAIETTDLRQARALDRGDRPAIDPAAEPAAVRSQGSAAPAAATVRPPLAS